MNIPDEEWIKEFEDGRKEKFIYQELPEDGAFITAQLEGNEIVYSVVFEEIRHDEMGYRDALKIAQAKLESRNKTFDATANYCSAAVVRRRRRLSRVLQMGEKREPECSRDGPAHHCDLVTRRRVALALL